MKVKSVEEVKCQVDKIDYSLILNYLTKKALLNFLTIHLDDLVLLNHIFYIQLKILFEVYPSC
jgi:hypothetical protein